MAFLLSSLTFLVVAAALLALLIFSGTGRKQETIRRRLEAVEKSQRRGSVSLEMELIRDELLSDVPLFHRLMTHWTWSWRIRDFALQAGLHIRPAKLIVLSIGSAAAACLVSRVIFHNLLITLGATLGGSFIPFGYVAIKRWRRLLAFERNFPEAIDLLGRAVRAGHAFTTGMEMIGRELPEPVAGEFRVTFEEQNFGLPLKEALLNLTERVPLLDVRFFVTALLIQKETGGNLAEILDNLSQVIRERFKIYGEVRVKTAHGRLTAGILIALPPVMMALLGSVNPHYVRILFDDPWGPYMLFTAGLMQVTGSALLWKIVHIEV